jgi:hypothetical protein
MGTLVEGPFGEIPLESFGPESRKRPASPTAIQTLMTEKQAMFPGLSSTLEGLSAQLTLQRTVIDPSLEIKLEELRNHPEYETEDEYETLYNEVQERFQEIHSLLSEITQKTASDHDSMLAKISDLSQKNGQVLIASQTNKVFFGKVKKVAVFPTFAIYTAKEGTGLGGKVETVRHEHEIADEVKTVETLKRRLSEEERANIVTDYTVLTPRQKLFRNIEGYAVQTNPASSDLEKRITSGIGYPDTFRFAGQYLNGVRCLHKAGIVNGDQKPENALIFDNTTKVSDLGKAAELLKGEMRRYTGNPRYSPPECLLSQSGEVYSASLIMLRSLERPYLNREGVLVDPKGVAFEVTAQNSKDNSLQAKARQGIEGYVVRHKDCLQSEFSHMRGKFRVLCSRVKAAVTNAASPEELTAAQAAVHNYIDIVTSRMASDSSIPIKDELRNQMATDLGSLLKRMTLSEASLRPTAEEAYTSYRQILEAAGMPLE